MILRIPAILRKLSGLRLYASLLCVMLTACAAACAGQSSEREPSAPGFQAVPAAADALPLDSAAPSGVPALPSPAQLTKLGAAAEGDRRLDGAEFDDQLPRARTFVEGQNLNFAPAGEQMDGLAFAIYHFDLPGYNGPGSVSTSWDSLPAEGNYFIGVADFGRNAWKWFSPEPASVLSLPGALDFMSPAEQVYVVVALTGSAVQQLTEINFGGDQPPVAVLRPQFYFADADSTIEFDASASSDDVSIVKYEWDLDSDGSFELDSGTDPLVSKHYSLAGDFTVQLRVTDDAGQSTAVSADLHIDGSGYDETEGNNDVASADLLPPGGFDGWDGNLGEGGYDGGTTDYYRFSVSAPMRVVFEVEELTVELFKLALFSSNGANLLQDGDNMTEDTNLFYYFDTPGSYILTVDYSGNVSADYSLGAEVVYGAAYDEVEPNNSRPQANVLDPAGLRNLWANLGAGGYDGGSEDWYSLSVEDANSYYTFSIDNYTSQVNLDLELYDGDTLLQSSELDINHEYLGYGFENTGTYYLRVLIRDGEAPGAEGDYLLHLMNNGAMPEVVLTAVPDNGTRPLQVSFDASDSVIPPGNAVVEYYWDLNGDGYAEQVTTQNEPSTTATYYAAGTYQASVTIKLATLAFGSGSVEISVTGASSETEPNNDFPGAQPLPAFPFASFYGDVGPGGNDGGSHDYYIFTLFAGQTVSFSLDYQPAFIFVGAQLLINQDGEYVPVDESYENDGNEFVSYTNSSGLPITVYFAMISDPEWPGGYGGYRVSGSVV